MRNRRTNAVVAALALVGLVGCGGGGSGPKAATPPIGDAAIQGVDAVAQAGLFRQPLDAAPSPKGDIIYFVATADGGAGIFSVPTDGGMVAAVATGGAFVKPTAVAVASDGSRVFAADPRAGTLEAPGIILTAPTTGGSAGVSVLAGTEGRAAHGLDVVGKDGSDLLYFTGTDPVTGAAGVFRMPAAGGAVTTVAEGAPFASLDALVVTAQGDVYVSDRGVAPGQGLVYRVRAGTITPILSSLRLGAPAGVTLIHDDATLLVSTVDANSLADQVLSVDLASGRRATSTIGTSHDSAGGLHRAANAAVLAWCDTAGQVYRVRPR